MIIAIWGYSTSLSEASFGFNLPTLVYIFYIWYFLFSKLPIALLCGIKVSDFYKNMIYSMVTGYYMMIDLIIGQILSLLGVKTSFLVTPKYETRIDILDKNYIFVVLMSTISIIGIIFWNPLALIYNFAWIIPLIIAPILIPKM